MIFFFGKKKLNLLFLINNQVNEHHQLVNLQW